MPTEAEIESVLSAFEPEFRNFARGILGVFLDLDNDLLGQGLDEGERKAIHDMVFAALDCHLTGCPPPSKEVKFWMTTLDPRVFLSSDPAEH